MTVLPQILRSLSLFEHASDEAIDELIHLSSTRLRSYEAGDIVMTVGAGDVTALGARLLESLQVRHGGESKKSEA